MNKKILIVDDEPANLRMLERLFRQDYEPLTAASGAEALEVLALYDVALIVADQRMPNMTGIELLKSAAALRPQTVRMILTGYTDVNDLVEAINAGVVYKYVTKPWVNLDLLQTIRGGMEHYEATKRQHLLRQDNERLQNQLQASVRASVDLLREMIAQKNTGLAEHCRRTAGYATLIGSRLGVEAGDLEHLISAALLHEFPCIRIPFSLDLNKSALSVAQFRSTRDRFEHGLRMMSGISTDLEPVVHIIRYQHENFDGSGFFEGLNDEKIPLLSRILAVASAFDERHTRSDTVAVCSEDEVRSWLQARSGSQFDPKIVEACVATGLVEKDPSPPTIRFHPAPVSGREFAI